MPLVAVLGNTDYRLRHRGYIDTTPLSSDGKLIAAAGEEDEVRLRDAETGGLHSHFLWPSTVRSLTFGPKDERLYVASADGIEVLDGRSAQRLRELSPSGSKCQPLALRARSRRV